MHGIPVNANERFYEWCLVYDFDSMLVQINSQISVNLQYTEQHVPISVSVCSNVDDHTEPRCIVESNVDSLVEQKLDYMLTTARKAAELTKEKFSDVFDSVFDERICNDVFESLGDDEEIQKMINEDRKFTNKLKEEFEKIL